MDIIRTKTTEEFVRMSAQWIAGVLYHATENGKTATVGLSGGSTPEPVYTMLAANNTISWDRVRVFLLDERFVPNDHKDSNQAMIRRTLLTRAGSDATLLAPDTSLPMDRCITSYADQLKGIEPDLVILGMGVDGHITSLFPPVPPEAFGPSDVIHTTTDRFAVRDRLSVTFPILERAQKRVFLITGKEKSALLEKIEHDSLDPSMLPAQAFVDAATTWIVGP